MTSVSILNWLTIIVSILALIVITYTSIFVNSFKDAQETSNFFHDSNTYYYIAEIIKTHIRDRYPTELQNNVVRLAVADRILDLTITENVVEHVTLPVLQVQSRVSKLPLESSQGKVMLNTQQYTQDIPDTISSLDLPPALNDAAQKLTTSIPPEITILDANEKPNSILRIITQTRAIFDHAQDILIGSWVVLVLTVGVMIFINLKTKARLLVNFLWIFATTGIVVIGLSFLSPAVTSALPISSDPLTGSLKNSMMNDIVTHYFVLTRNLGIIYLLICFGCYLLNHYLPHPKPEHP